MKNKKQASKYAYCCLIMKGDRYVPGAIVTAHSIRKTGTNNDIICMVTPDVSVSAIANLRVVFDRVVPVEYLNYETGALVNSKFEKLYGNWKSVSYTKWNVLNQIEYKKVILLDSDLIVLKNLDGLFNLNTPAATFSLPQSELYQKNGFTDPYKTVKHGKYVSKSQISLGYSSFVSISTSIIVCPNSDHFELYKRCVRDLQPISFPECRSPSDEVTIVWFYDKILKKRWTHIHQAFNAIPWYDKWLPPSGKYSKPYIAHYVCEIKPWETKRSNSDDFYQWWGYADDVRKHYPTLNHLFTLK